MCKICSKRLSTLLSSNITMSLSKQPMKKTKVVYHPPMQELAVLKQRLVKETSDLEKAQLETTRAQLKLIDKVKHLKATHSEY